MKLKKVKDEIFTEEPIRMFMDPALDPEITIQLSMKIHIHLPHFKIIP
jgi:hypothetical protein